MDKKAFFDFLKTRVPWHEVYNIEAKHKNQYINMLNELLSHHSMKSFNRSPSELNNEEWWQAADAAQSDPSYVSVLDAGKKKRDDYLRSKLKSDSWEQRGEHYYAKKSEEMTKEAGRGDIIKKWIERTPLTSNWRTVMGDSALGDKTQGSQRQMILDMFKKQSGRFSGTPSPKLQLPPLPASKPLPLRTMVQQH